MAAREPPQADVVAEAAVRRLGSSRPLYGVSLCTALSQLLRPNVPKPKESPVKPASDSCVSQSMPTDCGEGFLNFSESLQTPGFSSAQQAPTRNEADRRPVATKPWLTGQFVAQVRAHFETALVECFPSHGSTGEADSAEDSEESDGEARKRYVDALSRAALQWGILLLLAAEPFLMSEDMEVGSQEGPDAEKHQGALHGPGGAREAIERSKPNRETARSPEVSAEAADTVVREALSVFEMVTRVSLSTATRLLPKLLAWLDAALSYSLGRKKANEFIQTADLQNSRKTACVAASDDVAGFVVQHITRGPLCSIVSCVLDNCRASGYITKSAHHLRRVRFLGLLLRGPFVTRCCAQLLAACAMTPANADGKIARGSGMATGTVPLPPVDSETSEEATEGEAEVQQRLCSETARVLCVALQNLKDALLPSTQNATSVDALVAGEAQRSDPPFDDAVEKAFLPAFLPPQLRWLPDAHNAGNVYGTRRTPEEAECPWAFVGADSEVAEETPRKAALYLLGGAKGLLLSFALGIEGSPKCLNTFGVSAAAADKSVVRQAKELLNQSEEFFLLSADEPRLLCSLELSPATWIHCVTRLCSLALTAKHLPKSFQINPGSADSRILLTVKAASTVAELQVSERGMGVVPRCPLTGRLQLPQGLPDEHFAEDLPQHLGEGRSGGYCGHGGGFLAYLSDEGALRMATQVARILFALISSVSSEKDARIVGLIVPPLLRVLDIPQCEVRFLGWRCLKELILTSPKGALDAYRVPILQALMGGFPIFNELDICFNTYLEAYIAAVCHLSQGRCDSSFLQCQDFLIDMCHTVLASKEGFRAAFLSHTRPLLKFAGESANLRLYDWLAFCLEALEGTSVEAMVEGFRTLELLLAIGMDMEEFLPQILCRLAVASVVAKEKSSSPSSSDSKCEYKKLGEAVTSVAQRLTCSADTQLLAATTTNVVSCLKQLHSEEPSLVDGVIGWVSEFSALLKERHIDNSNSKTTSEKHFTRLKDNSI